MCVDILRICVIAFLISSVIVSGDFDPVKIQIIYASKCHNSSISEQVRQIIIPQHLLEKEVDLPVTSLVLRLADSHSPLKCKEGTRILTFDLAENKNPIYDTHVEAGNETSLHSNLNGLTGNEFVEPYLSFTSQGFVINDGEYFTPKEYCVNDFQYSELEIHACLNPCSEENPSCIRKCCKPGYSLSIFTMSCQPSGEQKWKPIFYVNHPSSQTTYISNIPHFIFSKFECSSESESNHGNERNVEIWPLRNILNEYNETIEKLPWRLLQDGSINYLHDRKWKRLDSENFCIDGMMDFGNGKFLSGQSQDQVLLYCGENVEKVNLSMLYVTVMFVSSIFLLLTSIVYCLLFQNQNIHGWTVLCFCVSMFLMYQFLGIAQLLGMYRTVEEESDSSRCIIIGILAHFWFISSFCWLTLVNLDLCLTFRSPIPGTGRSKGLKRFMGYFAFATIVPLTVVSTGLILQKKYPDPESGIIVPGYGQVSCFVVPSAQGVYLYYIIACLLACNLLLIATTVITIYRLRRNCKLVLTKKSTKHHQSNIKLFAKLFVIMGLTWAFDVISWAVNPNGTTKWQWVVLDMINLLQAVAIFKIFILKRTTINQVYARFPKLKKLIKGKDSDASSSKSNGFKLGHKNTISRATTGSSIT